ncbi:MAG: 4-hydroxybenzoate octaprenyltransferase [Hyphomicrobiaceae bacterium]
MVADTPAAASPMPVADAPPHNWVDRFAPAAIQPYLRLARLDRPIGTWLLLFPCWWGVGLAGVADRRPYPDLWFLLLFLTGAFLMRGSGCAYNDYVDRDIDAKVARTASRPIPSGQVSPNQALTFATMLACIAFLVLAQFNWFTIQTGVASLAIVAIYPFLKRYTNWPQVGLGLAFNWGALLGWSAVKGSIGWPAVLLYLGSICWTIGYDTIYAHQDKKDDQSIGLKSTAITFGDNSPIWIGGFYAAAVTLWLIAGFVAGAHLIFVTSVVLVSLQLSWQVVTLDVDNPANCLRRFRSNRDVGIALFLGLVTDMALSWFAGLS